MARITPGNRLYLYALFKREIGVGRQTMLALAEQVLADDDIWPQDLECADYREVMDALDDIVRVTVFKKGRVYVTLIPRPDFDEILEAPVEKPSPQQQQPKRSPGKKAWKQKKANKAPQPTKPHPQNRPVEPEPEPEPFEAPAATAETPVTDADVTASEAIAIDQPNEGTPKPTGIEGQSADEVLEASPEEVSAPQETDVAEQTVAMEPARPSIVFTIISEPDGHQDEQEAPEAQAPDKATIDEAAAREQAESESVPSEDSQEAAQAATDSSEPQAEAETEEEVRAEDASATDMPQEVAASESQEVAPATEASGHYSSLMEQILENERIHEEVLEEIFAGLPVRGPAESTLTRSEPAEPQRMFPTHFSTEVLCSNNELSSLYAILPFDVDPMALLDEDWKVSESCESYTFEGSHLTFPLRYLHTDDGQAVTVTLRRVAPGPTGKRWVLETIDVGDDVGFWGLPTKDEGAWSHLSQSSRIPERLVSPHRTLATFAHLGDVDEVLRSVADICEDEPWGKNAEFLVEYLSVTFFRIMRQDRLAISDDKTRAVLDTGLLTPEGDPIYCHFLDKEGHWHLDTFSTDDAGLAPKPATYVNSLLDITLAADAEVEIERAVERAFGPDIDLAIKRALFRAERNHRIATPAYDPQTDSLRLLVPITTPEGEVRALVLAPTDGHYCATALLPLEVAYACARSVSSEQPRWLTAGIA